MSPRAVDGFRQRSGAAGFYSRAHNPNNHADHRRRWIVGAGCPSAGHKARHENGPNGKLHLLSGLDHDLDSALLRVFAVGLTIPKVNEVLELRAVTKQFAAQRAVDDVSLVLARGEFF